MMALHKSRYARPLLTLCGALSLAGCGEETVPPAPIRPVLSVVVAPHTPRIVGFTGTVEPRYQVSLAFRILGRLISREVEVGDRVAAGRRLAAIDPLALDLAVRSAEAELSTARAQLANATGVEERQRTLLAQNTATRAQFEAAQEAKASAEAGMRRAEANLAKAREQLSYAELRSDTDGVVTAVGAQVGQVVSPGQAVVTVARPEIREAVLDVPENIGRDLNLGAEFDVALQLDPSIRVPGRLREIGPQADPTTRTRRLLLTLLHPPESFRLGTTVTVALIAPAVKNIELPGTAVLERDGRDYVWVVDPGASTVSVQEIKIAAREAAVARVAEGLAPGTRVVIAGVNSLQPGQRVKILDESAR